MSISFLLDIDFQLVGVVTISLLVEDLSNLQSPLQLQQGTFDRLEEWDGMDLVHILVLHGPSIPCL